MQESTGLPFESIVEKISEELFVFDSVSGNFVYSNKALLDDISYSESEFAALDWSQIFAEDQLSISKERLQEAINNKNKNVTFQTDLLRKDSSYYPAKVELSSFSSNGHVYILGICRNISEQKRNRDLLEEQKKKTRKLQLSTKYKSEFFANLSHEMRTTLNSVLLLSEILTENRADNLSDEQLKYSETIHRSTNSLLFLLNEFLDMAKIESGKISMRPELVEIYDFCKQLERLFQPVASEKGLRFNFKYDLQPDLPFKTDRMRLEQVLKNLISNALKFTSEGTVQLRVFSSADQLAMNNGVSEQILFEVQDTGIGISKDKQEHIFDSYVQAEGAETASKFGGTGLGLSISNEIITLLGGSIDIESTIGEGSTFTVKLPLDSSEAIIRHATEGKVKLSTAPAKGDRFPQIANSNSEKINGTVLLIDDSETHNMALSEFLSFKVNHCVTAESAKQAFDILNREPVHCIILDMYLPDASGKEVLRTLKNDDQLSNIPVIIYSGKNISQEEEQDMETYADAIIQKNVMSYKVLLSKITGVLRKVSEPMR